MNMMKQTSLLCHARATLQQAEGLFAQCVSLCSAGKLAEAEAGLHAILAENPEHFKSLRLLGQVCAQQGRFADAQLFLGKAAKLNRHDADLSFWRGFVLQSIGRNEEAIECYSRVIRQSPAHADAHGNTGLALYHLGKPDAAIASFDRAILHHPDYVFAHFNLGIVHQAMGRLFEAEKNYRDTLALDSGHVAALTNLGVVLQMQRRFPEAISCYTRALAIDGRNILALTNLGTAQQALGMFPEAKANYRRVLAISPEEAGAYLYYVNIGKITAADQELLATMENLAARSDLPPAAQSDLHFALGKSYDDLGRYDEAFSHFDQANRLHQVSFDREQHVRAVTELIEKYPKEFFAAREGFGNPSARPVLVVGMPRCGSTLVEQMIASHPEAFGADELPFWNGKMAMRDHPEKLDAKAAGQLADEYLQQLQAFSADALRVVDKMPGNFYFLGLIRLSLPGARIIHCRRNRLDTCLSIYFQKFSFGHEYAYSLADIACVYRQYERLMAHWRAVLPGEMLEIDYESLIADTSTTGREIVEFCGLQWNERCLDFRASANPVLTASAWQVRQPLYNTSVSRAAHYRKYLEPLFSAGMNLPE